jgi:hypothetical protein
MAKLVAYGQQMVPSGIQPGFCSPPTDRSGGQQLSSAPHAPEKSQGQHCCPARVQ